MNDIIQNIQCVPHRDPHQQLLDAEKLMARYQQHVVGFTKRLHEANIEFLTSTYTLSSETEGLSEYLAQTLIFNTRLRAYPSVIVKCKTNDDVIRAYRYAIESNLPIRVRSGGHDHEGECTGNDVVLLDLSGLKHLCIEEDQKHGFVAHIGSGYRFYQLVPELAAYSTPLTIAHGTCATVGLAGYIQGGGWGPWTRRHGMGCESLVAAKVLLANGTVVDADENNHKDLLWAIRGGGAFSYGIVLEFTVKAFPIPDEIHRFEIHWNTSDCDSTEASTFEVLSQWETAINDPDTTALVGTNLKIDAIALTNKDVCLNVKALEHPCTMYGYWDGDEASLGCFIKQYFGNAKYRITSTDTPTSYSPALMGNWARKSLHEHFVANSAAGVSANQPFPPDYDEPAPHKITSKVVTKEGLNEQGKEQLITSLTSSLLNKKSPSLGLFSYVTLGAISGPFYKDETVEAAKKRMAFPYATYQYTIQYQTWWNEKVDQKALGQNNPVFNYVNRALDWMEVCRDTEIVGTKGAFISFKDSSIPTKTYFLDNYDKLVKIKRKYSQPSAANNIVSKSAGFNHLRTRKTII